MLNPLLQLMSTRLIVITIVTLVVMGIGLMAGVLMTEKKSSTPQTSSFEMPRGRVMISSVKLRWLVIKTMVLLAIGVILLAYGYGTGNTVLRAIGYLSLFFAFTLLGGLLSQTNV
jgi:hypothetical protein